MKALAKFTLKTYSKPSEPDPVQRRRVKLLSAIDLQSAALPVACAFWSAAVGCAHLSRGFRGLARQMLDKLEDHR